MQRTAQKRGAIAAVHAERAAPGTHKCRRRRCWQPASLQLPQGISVYSLSSGSCEGGSSRRVLREGGPRAEDSRAGEAVDLGRSHGGGA